MLDGFQSVAEVHCWCGNARGPQRRDQRPAIFGAAVFGFDLGNPPRNVPIIGSPKEDVLPQSPGLAFEIDIVGGSLGAPVDGTRALPWQVKLLHKLAVEQREGWGEAVHSYRQFGRLCLYHKILQTKN